MPLFGIRQAIREVLHEVTSSRTLNDMGTVAIRAAVGTVGVGLAAAAVPTALVSRDAAKLAAAAGAIAVGTAVTGEAPDPTDMVK